MAARARPFDAVIFDVDGVLVQSMENHCEAYRRVFAGIGVAIEKMDVFDREGKRAPEVVEGIARARGLNLTEAQVAALAKEKQELFFTFGPAPLYPGVEDLVARLKANGVRIGLASGTFRRNVENHLGAFIKNFEAVVSSNDVTHTKPHPEPYLTAMAKLGVAANRTLVVENAPLGITAGKAAGARVYAVTSTLPADRLREADAIFLDIPALARHLAEAEGL